jgi:hypothetical protein
VASDAGEREGNNVDAGSVVKSRRPLGAPDLGSSLGQLFPRALDVHRSDRWHDPPRLSVLIFRRYYGFKQLYEPSNGR